MMQAYPYRAAALRRRTPCPALSSIASQPPPPWSSWSDYAATQAGRPFARLRARDQLAPSALYYSGGDALGGDALADGSRRARSSTVRASSPRPSFDSTDLAVLAAGPADVAAEPSSLAFVRGFALRPRDVVARLDEYVIGQEAAKRVLAVAVCDHFNHARRCLDDPTLADAERAKPNVLVVGPTGSGKTFLVRTLARLLRVPFVKADATKFSATGYIGRDVDELARELAAAGDGAGAAAHGIIYVDEVDKLCAPGAGLVGSLLGGGGGGGGSGVNTRDVQTSLLKLMEDADVPLGAAASPHAAPKHVSTRHVLWIFSGAFNSMHARLLAAEAREDARLAAAAAAGAADGEAGEAGEGLRKARRLLARARETVTSEALVEAGLEPEFCGRLPVRVRCAELTEADYVAILTRSKASILAQLADDFRGYGIELEVADGAVRRLAALALEQGTGARGLVTVAETVFRDLKFELPSSGVSRVVIDEALVDDPERGLRRLLDAHRARGGDDAAAAVGAAAGGGSTLPSAAVGGGGDEARRPGAPGGADGRP